MERDETTFTESFAKQIMPENSCHVCGSNGYCWYSKHAYNTEDGEIDMLTCCDCGYTAHRYSDNE